MYNNRNLIMGIICFILLVVLIFTDLHITPSREDMDIHIKDGGDSKFYYLDKLEEIKTLQEDQIKKLDDCRDILDEIRGEVKLYSYLMSETGLDLESCKVLRLESEENNIPLDLILGLFDYESNFNPDCKNPRSTATGLGQFLYSTGKWVAGQRGVEFSPEMLKDPIYNIQHTIWYLNHLYKETGSWDSTLARYGDQTPTYSTKVLNKGIIYRKGLEGVR